MQFYVLLRAKHVTTVSPYLARRIRWLKPSVTVIPNGLEDVWFEASEQAEPGSINSNYFLSVNSGFTRRKNVRRLLAAFAGCPVENKKLVLVGPGYESDGPAQSWARSAGFTENVFFLGPQGKTALIDLYDGALALVHPALEESFGMTVLEAMVRGTPVIAGRRSGALPWLLEFGNNTTPVDVKSLRALSQALLDRKYASRGQSGRSSRLEEFRLSSVAQQYLDICARISGP